MIQIRNRSQGPVYLLDMLVQIAHLLLVFDIYRVVVPEGHWDALSNHIPYSMLGSFDLARWLKTRLNWVMSRPL
jgi:hypothetical protein